MPKSIKHAHTPDIIIMYLVLSFDVLFVFVRSVFGSVFG